MPSPTWNERAVVTVITVEDTSDGGSSTGHVVLGVLGSVAFAFILVVIIVPLVRWRKRRGSSVSESRTSSRRTHARIVSEYNQDAVAPLLEEQPSSMALNENARMVSQGPKTQPSRPPTAMLNWKILQNLPNFDDDSSGSSLGNPLDPKDRAFPETDTDVRLVDGDKRTAVLPPIPVSEEPSRSSTRLSPVTPTSPFINAFQRSVSLTASESISNTNSGSTFRYPSLGSSSSRSSAPSLDLPRISQIASHTPPWLPKSLVPGSEGSSQPSDTWRRVPSMPPIPESVHSGSNSSLHHVPGMKKESPPPIVHLRNSNPNAGPSTIQHIGEHSGETPSHGSLSRSSTQHTNQSNKASFAEGDERRVSTLTHGTFGRQGHMDSKDSSYARPSTSEEGVLVAPPLSPKKPEEPTLKHVKRRTFDFPREPSPPLTPAPLMAPPPLRTPRPGYSSQSTRPSSQPILDPQSPDEVEPEAENRGPYGHNEEASSSSEQLLPSSDAAPLLLELPTLPQLSPLSFEFKLGSAATLRSNTASTRSGSRKSSDKLRIKGKGLGHSKSPSKSSTASAGTGTGSKRSLRSLASFNSTRSGSSRSGSRSKSRERERTKHARRVTFGDVANPSPPPVPDIQRERDESADVSIGVLRPETKTVLEQPPALGVPQPQRRASRPLPTLPGIPVMSVPGYNPLLSGQTKTMQDRS